MAVYSHLLEQTLHELLPDHKPLLVQFASNVEMIRRGFCFCNMWTMSTEYKELIDQQWQWQRQLRGTSMFQIVQKSRTLQQPLQCLHKLQFGNIGQQVDEAESVWLGFK